MALNMCSLDGHKLNPLIPDDANTFNALNSPERNAAGVFKALNKIASLGIKGLILEISLNYMKISSWSFLVMLTLPLWVELGWRPISSCYQVSC